jgi:RNA polymerase sigma-70 factor (ECF subfamily)
MARRADRPSPGGENLSTARALAMVAGLPPDQAEAVRPRVVTGLSAPAAAEVLGKRPGAVRTAAHRGLRRLAEQLTAGRRGTPPAGGAGGAPAPWAAAGGDPAAPATGPAAPAGDDGEV